ncbi:hypothetical protein Tco_0980589 [Tanacetum coccineum]
MFKQLHINISLADALILIPKYQKELKSSPFQQGEAIEIAHTVSEKIAAALSKEASRKASYYEANLRVPLILGRPFLRTARALIDVYGEEMILCDGNERLILNMRYDTSSYSNEPHQESINMIDVYNVSHEEIRENLFATNHPSGNPTSSLVSSHTNLTSPKVNNDIFDPEEDIIENLLNLYKKQKSPSVSNNQLKWAIPLRLNLEDQVLLLLPPHLSPSKKEMMIFPLMPNPDLLELEYLLNHDPIKDMDSILEDSVDENSLDDTHF